MPVKTKSKQGWVILHPNGWVEADYFDSELWICKGIVVSQKTWMKHFRPNCRAIRATLTWDEPQGPTMVIGKKVYLLPPRPIKRRKHSKSRSISCPICAPDRCEKAPW